MCWADCLHGGGLEAAARKWGCAPEHILDLSTGLHPEGPPAWLGDWLREHASLAGRYPDADGEPARSTLAKAFGVAPECVLIAAGAQALIEVVVRAMGWRTLAIETPCYAEPLRCARRAGAALREYHLGEAPAAADALWITSPHNPDGRLRPFPSGCVGVLDESYLPFAARKELGLMPDVIRIGSLTKLFAIPGIRLGYAVAEAATVSRLRSGLPPWPAPTPALHLLPALLAEAEAREASIVRARQRLERLLDDYGWQRRPSDASFVLARPVGAIPDFARFRILVRTFPEWPELHGWVRFGLCREKALGRLRNALEAAR